MRRIRSQKESWEEHEKWTLNQGGAAIWKQEK